MSEERLARSVYIIAEAGVNHNGDLQMALDLVRVAKESGANAVKFQTFKPGECTGKYAVKVDYLSDSSSPDESRFDLTCKLALPFENFVKIKSYADDVGIDFITTPDGFDSLEFVVQNLNVRMLKISSTEVTNLEYLKAVSRADLPVILSTGMSNLGEVEMALNALRGLKKAVTLLHCVSEYPAPLDQVNLRAMKTIKDAFGVPVGLSDHTAGFEASVAAVALGATVIEKHFTLDKTLAGPDHKASMDPEELNQFVHAIRNTELLLGNGRKTPSISERKNIDGIRRSVVAARDMPKGTVLKRRDLTLKRPGSGVHPYDVDKLVGLKIHQDLCEDEPVSWKIFHEPEGRL